MSSNNNDVAEAIAKIPEKFAQIWEEIKQMLFGTGEAVSEGVKGIIEWVISAITGFINWIVNAVNTYIVQPVISFLTSIFPWIWERLHRSLIIVFTVPPTVKAIKRAIKRPGERTFMKIVLTPVMGYFGGEIAWHLLNAFLGLKPGQVPQVSIPFIMPTRPGVTTVYPGQLSVRDTLELKDVLSLQATKGVVQELLDQLNITDELTLQTISYVAKLTDNVAMSDMLTIRTAEPNSITPTETLPISDSLSIEAYYREYELPLSDQLNITDEVTLQLIEPAKISTEETLDMSDSISQAVGNIACIDTLNMTDEVELHHGIPTGSYILVVTQTITRLTAPSYNRILVVVS